MYTISLKDSYFPAQRDNSIEPMTIGDMLRRSAAAFPDVVALKELTLDGNIGRVWTYQSLLTDTERLGRALANRHAPGARIAIWANNLPEWVLLEFAAALAGLILVTVNPAYQVRELKFVLRQSRAEALYYVKSFRGNPMEKIAVEACADNPSILRTIVLTDDDALFEGESGGVLPNVRPNDVAQIQYTSGTTGFPKGALLHHEGLVRNARDSLARAGVGEGDVVMHNMPLFHTTGCAVLVLGSISLGTTILLAPIFDPEMIGGFIERERATYYFGVPTMIIAMIEEVRESGRDVSSIRSITSGGAMVAPELVRQSNEVLGSNIQIVYGQTESSPVITMAWPDDSIEDLTKTAGQPLPNVEVSIRSPQTNAIVPIGEQGEICARGYLVMTGYNDNLEATENAIDPAGWLHTGDLGTMDARGYVKITGRVKEMIIRGGENLFPAEIENTLLEHNEIAEVAVIGVPDEKWGEQVACFMRASGDTRSGAKELKAFIRERLSPQKTPAYWIWVDEWPLTGSGKIQKFKLVEQFADGAHEIMTA